jgi:hypothetical protein
MTLRLLELVAALLAVGLSAAGCSSAPPAPTAQKFADKENQFSLTIPADWRQRPSNPGADLELIPAEEAKPGTLRESMRVHVEPISGLMTLNEFFAVKLAEAAKADPEVEYKEIEKGVTQAGPSEARKLIYSMKHGDMPATTVAWFLVKGGRGYTLLGTATPERFAAVRPKFEEIAASFVPEAP